MLQMNTVNWRRPPGLAYSLISCVTSEVICFCFPTHKMWRSPHFFFLNRWGGANHVGSVLKVHWHKVSAWLLLPKFGSKPAPPISVFMHTFLPLEEEKSLSTC